MDAAINPQYPVTEPTSLDEIMDLAVAMEHQAAERYEELARQMDQRGVVDLAQLFRELALLEKQHEDGLADWAERTDGRRPRPARVHWAMPESFGEESDEPLDPFRALAVAVRNEERAFAFFTYLAAMAGENATLRERAEKLAKEELAHVAKLRQWRRRAWHQSRADRRVLRVSSVERLYEVAQGLELSSARVEALAAKALEREGRADAARLLEICAGEARKIAAEFGLSPADLQGSPAAEAARASGLFDGAALNGDTALNLACRDAEEVVEIYFSVADRAGDGALLVEAQRLAEAALARVAMIRSQTHGLG